MKLLHYALALFFVSAACGAGELHLYVNSRSFDVAVAPVDEESAAAEQAILYARTGVNEEWESLGPCRKIVLPGGEVRFTREIDVDHDGIFLYTSRPVVGGEVTEPPGLDDPAQASVVVDTLPPTVEIVLPPEGSEARGGDPIALSWIISDEHLADDPGVLTFSTDGGRSWNLVKRGLPAEGDLTWTAPADVSGPTVLRLAAADRAGNVGRTVRSVELAPAALTRGDDGPSVVVPDQVSEIVIPHETVVEKERDPNAS